MAVTISTTIFTGSNSGPIGHVTVASPNRRFEVPIWGSNGERAEFRCGSARVYQRMGSSWLQVEEDVPLAKATDFKATGVRAAFIEAVRKLAEEGEESEVTVGAA